MNRAPDNPKINDNRNYIYNDNFYMRDEFPIIKDWIKDGSRIIDLGCGNGSLIRYLLDNKTNISIEGIEMSESGVNSAQKYGFKVKQGFIDKLEAYKEYKDEEFDYAICNATLQMVMHPEVLIKEMKKISKFQIITFPNFAYIFNRFELLFLGKMPETQLYGYRWYNTGHIHQLSIKDFKEFIKENGLCILKEKYIGGIYKIFKTFPNLMSREGIFLLSKK